SRNPASISAQPSPKATPAQSSACRTAWKRTIPRAPGSCCARPPTPATRSRLTLAGASGRPSAQGALAWMYAQGIGGTDDPARAARLYLQAANAGDPSAQNNAGELYETGRGTKPDPKRAFDWYRKAAEAGFAPAQFNL